MSKRLAMDEALLKSETVAGQAVFCCMSMDRIYGHIAARERLAEQWHTKTAIQREITELRAALLELSKMLEV